ncbi:MAG: DUF4270 domain-containing protein [Bacteroidales bacterium]|nr:DUF4270 domain-containing protein [Bacteroidales bacterium]
MKKNLLCLFCSLLAVLFAGCEKEIDTIGLNLQDESLLNAEFTQIPLSAYSVLEDSINTKNLINNMLGSVNDPVFGKTEAGFCTQFILSGSNVTFDGYTPTIDSVVLTLQYSGYFGDTLSPLRLQVYKLSESLSQSAYYSNDVPSITGGNLVYSNASLSPKPSSSVVIDSITSAAHMRVRLNDDFGRFLLQDCDLTSTTSFQNDFYGLAVKAQLANSSQTGNMCYISLTSSLSGISVYYTLNGEQKKYSFPISSACTRYNFFTHDYSSAAPNLRRQVLNHETTLGAQELYLQPTGGIKTRINMPQLPDYFTDKNVIINKAELVITNISQDEAYLFNPYNLGLQVVNKDNTLSYVPDDAYYTSSDYFGGIYDETSHEYRFRVTNYVQNIVKNKEITDDGINIVITGAGIRGNRLVFRGTDESYSDRLRLDVYYTTYK